MSNGRTDEAVLAPGRLLPQPRTEDLDLVTVFAALADPSRLALVRAYATMAEPEPCHLTAARLSIAPSTVSHHLRVLREAGLTSTRVNGRSRDVTLRRDDLGERFPGLLDVVLAG